MYFQTLLWPIYVFLVSMPWWSCNFQLKLEAAWKYMFFRKFWICYLLVSLNVSLIQGWKKKRKKTPSLCLLCCNCIKKRKTAIQYKKGLTHIYNDLCENIKMRERFGEKDSGLDCQNSSRKTNPADIRANKSTTSCPRKVEKSGRLKRGKDEQNSTLNFTVIHPEVL